MLPVGDFTSAHIRRRRIHLRLQSKPAIRLLYVLNFLSISVHCPEVIQKLSILLVKCPGYITRWSQFLHVWMKTTGFLLTRNMSTTIGDRTGADKIEYMADMADVLADKTMEIVSTQTSVLSEVVVAAADSWLLVAALQYAIDGIHNFTGLNWWASIV